MAVTYFGNKVYLSSELTVDGAGNSAITGNYGDFSVTASSGKYFANSTFSLDQIIRVEDERKWTVAGTKGNDTFTFGDGGGIYFGNGGQDIVTAGVGQDIIALGNQGGTLVENSNIDVKYYTYGEDKIWMGAGSADLKNLDDVKNNLAMDIAGQIGDKKLGAGNNVFIGSQDSVTKVTLTDAASGNDLNVWFGVSENGLNINAASETKNIYMQGGNGADTLVGGAGKDTIVAGDGDIVWGGGGSTSDVIYLDGAGNSAVGFAAGTGVDSVYGFKAGFEASNDAIWLFENSITDVAAKAENGNLVISLGNDRTIFDNVNGDASNTVQLLVQGAEDTEKQKVYLGISGNDQVFVANGEGNDADYYIGTAANHSTISFAGAADGVAIDLSKSGVFEDTRVYQNIDEVVGGSGADSIVGSEDAANVLNGGDGNDHIWGKGAKVDTLFGGNGADTFYFGAGDGKDIIGDFNAGFAEGNDVVNLHSLASLDGARAGVDATGNAYVSIAGTSDTLTFKGGLTKNTFQLLASDQTGTQSKIWIGNNSSDVVFNADAGNLADIYIGGTVAKGNYATLDLTDSSLDNTAFNIDLRDESKYINVHNVIGSNMASTLIGAASGASSVQGGEGNDSLYGGSLHDDMLKGGNGADMFFFDAGDGQDVVMDYNQADGDTVKFWASTTGVGVQNSNGNVVLSLGDDTLTLAGLNTADPSLVEVEMADDTKVKALIGVDGKTNELGYTSDINNYYGGNKADTIVVSGTDNAEIWLDNRGAQFYHSVENINAAEAMGDVILAGAADVDSKIAGGKGKSSLWGGSGAGNDTLTGGSGTDVFFYGMDEGNDVIEGGDKMDKVMIYSPEFAVKSTELKSGNLTITTANDNTLTIRGWNSDGLNTFELSDGTQWSYDQDKKEWAQK